MSGDKNSVRNKRSRVGEEIRDEAVRTLLCKCHKMCHFNDVILHCFFLRALVMNVRAHQEAVNNCPCTS